MIHKRIFCFAFLLLSLILSSAHAADDHAARYQECTALTLTNPDQALSKANKWYAESKDSAAQHCKALALYNLKRYSEAATELEQLADVTTTKQANLWLNLLKQAAQAHIYASEYLPALGNLNKAIDFAQSGTGHTELPGLLLDRARLHRLMKNPLPAIQDLDNIISLSSSPQADVLLERADTLISLKDMEAAQEDIMKVLRKDPSNARARALMASTSKQ